MTSEEKICPQQEKKDRKEVICQCGNVSGSLQRCC